MIPIQESAMSAEEFRIDSALCSAQSRPLKNEFAEFLRENLSELQDAIYEPDCLLLLPSTKQFAIRLLKEASKEVADELSWVKIGSRYWLRLYWN